LAVKRERVSRSLFILSILLQNTLNETLAAMPASGMAELGSLIDPAWIEQALHATGKASIRRRKLPAEHAVWLVIGLALFRHMPLWQVVQEMALTLNGQDLPVPSSSVQARQRLGCEPLAHLFGLLTDAWGRSHPVHPESLRVLAVDGVVWSAPDSQDNRQVLGSGMTQYGAQPWPMVRGVCLLDTDSHELLDARLGDYHCGELTLAADLRGLDQSITLFDRAYFSAAFLLDWQNAGAQRHWLMRAKDNLRHEIVQTLGEGDWLIRMPVSQRARQLRPELPSHWLARLIQVHAGGKTRRFITSLSDPSRFAAPELAQLYRQRWEIELGFREIKQSLATARPGRVAQQAARTGDARGLGRIDCAHAAAALDASDGSACRCGTHPHQLSHRAARDRRCTQHHAPGARGRLAPAFAAPSGSGSLLRAPASTT